MTLSAVPDRILDSEIDPEAHEQWNESDRDDVEGTERGVTASAVVIARPAKSVNRIAKTIFVERTATHRVKRIANIISPAINPALSISVANSSSASGTGPVRRTETPSFGLR